MTAWVWIEEREVLTVHGMLLAEHGGAAGVRDEGLLKSALARPQQRAAYGTPDAIELAAVYTAGIVGNHPFIDGNKRTGFVAGIMFLELNGWRFVGAEEAATRAVLALAAGEIDEVAYRAFLAGNSRPG